MKTRPLCGKCHSQSVYLDYDSEGNRFIVCLKCGNRHPGSREGFYMGTNESIGLQIRQETVTVLEGKPEETKPVKLCTICRTKPTISASSNICPSCMAKKASEKTRLAKIAANGSKPKETKEDKGQVEKTVPRPSQAVT